MTTNNLPREYIVIATGKDGLSDTVATTATLKHAKATAAEECAWETTAYAEVFERTPLGETLVYQEFNDRF